MARLRYALADALLAAGKDAEARHCSRPRPSSILSRRPTPSSGSTSSTACMIDFDEADDEDPENGRATEPDRVAPDRGPRDRR